MAASRTMALHKFAERQVGFKLNRSTKASAAHRHIAPIGPAPEFSARGRTSRRPRHSSRLVVSRGEGSSSIDPQGPDSFRPKAAWEGDRHRTLRQMKAMGSVLALL